MSVVNQMRRLNRDCDAILIPAGTLVSLPENTEVIVTQALGGHFTLNIHGNLVRISADDAEAIGLKPEDAGGAIDDYINPDLPLDEQVWEIMKTCFDPEIPVNVVDLGLIYSADIVDHPDGSGKRVLVKMTLTAPGCGFGPTLVAELDGKLRLIPEVVDTDIELVFDPAWNYEMMSEAAKLQLNMF